MIDAGKDFDDASDDGEGATSQEWEHLMSRAAGKLLRPLSVVFASCNNSTPNIVCMLAGDEAGLTNLKPIDTVGFTEPPEPAPGAPIGSAEYSRFMWYKFLTNKTVHGNSKRPMDADPVGFNLWLPEMCYVMKDGSWQMDKDKKLLALITADARTGKTFRLLRLLACEMLIGGNSIVLMMHNLSYAQIQEVVAEWKELFGSNGMYHDEWNQCVVPMQLVNGDTIQGFLSTCISAERPGIAFLQLNEDCMSGLKDFTSIERADGSRLGQSVTFVIDECHLLISGEADTGDQGQGQGKTHKSSSCPLTLTVPFQHRPLMLTSCVAWHAVMLPCRAAWPVASALSGGGEGHVRARV